MTEYVRNHGCQKKIVTYLAKFNIFHDRICKKSRTSKEALICANLIFFMTEYVMNHECRKKSGTYLGKFNILTGLSQRRCLFVIVYNVAGR